MVCYEGKIKKEGVGGRGRERSRRNKEIKWRERKKERVKMRGKVRQMRERGGRWKRRDRE